MAVPVRSLAILCVVLLVFAGEVVAFDWPTSPPLSGQSPRLYAMTGGLCAGKAFAFVPAAVLPEGISGQSIPGVNAWVPFPVNVSLDLEGQRCSLLGDFVALRRLNVSLRVADRTQPLNASEIWLAVANLELPHGVSEVNRALETWILFTQPRIDPGDEVVLGSVRFTWGLARTNRVTFSFEAVANTAYAGVHFGDELEFEVRFSMLLAETACFGSCWSPLFAGESTEYVVAFNATFEPA